MKKDLTEDPMSRPRLRALQYQHIDGTFELTFGGVFLLTAACFYGVGRIITSNSFMSGGLLPFVPLVVFVAGSFLIDALVQRFRMRVTYPRTGFISYQKPRPFKRSIRLAIWIGIPALTAAILAFLFLNRASFQTAGQDYVSFLMPSFTGLLFSGLWMIIGWKISLARFYLIAAASLLVAAGLFFNRVGGNTGLALLLGVMGAALCISGGLTLHHYLHQNPVSEETSDAE